MDEVEKDQTSNVQTDVEIPTVVTLTNIVTQLMVIIALFILVEKQKFREDSNAGKLQLPLKHQAFFEFEHDINFHSASVMAIANVRTLKTQEFVISHAKTTP